MREVNCSYKDEQYSVRDNGEVLRHTPIGKRPRPTDNRWSFGKPNDKTGYMEIATVRVHRIVATAFNGVAPSKEHVIDHIDTNKRNNRPENLRWVTRLENIILNPITAKRIAIVCGSVEAFLAEPSKFINKFPDPKFKWMCAVSKEEAQISLERMLLWAKSDKIPSGGTLGEWIFNKSIVENVPEIIESKTLNALQRDWKIPSKFPCCPMDYIGDPISTYAENLKPGAIFCLNDFYSSIVSKSIISNDRQSIFVMTESKESVKPWGMAEITFENGLFIHTSLNTFFELIGAEKQYCLAQGLEWTGGDSIDDYC